MITNTTATRFKKCPLCHDGMSRLHLNDYDPGVNFDSFIGWRCEACKSKFPAETGEKLENFIPESNEERYQEMIDNIPKLIEMKSVDVWSDIGYGTGSDTGDSIGSNTTDDMEQENTDTSLPVYDTPVANFLDARNCPYCKSKLLTSFRIDPEETFTRNFEGWFCLECTCTFSPKVAHLLEIRPDNSVELYGLTRGELDDDSLVVNPESIAQYMDSLTTQTKLEDSNESKLNDPEEQYAENNGRSIRRIGSLDELV